MLAQSDLIDERGFGDQRTCSKKHDLAHSRCGRRVVGVRITAPESSEVGVGVESDSQSFEGFIVVPLWAVPLR